MTENTNQTPGATAGYGPEGRELERESLAYGEPARTPGDVETAAAGDASEMLGEVLQSQELNPDEPAVTNEPPVMPQNPVATHQAAYQATYGRPNKQQRRHRLLLQLRHPVPPPPPRLTQRQPPLRPPSRRRTRRLIPSRPSAFAV